MIHFWRSWHATSIVKDSSVAKWTLFITIITLLLTATSLIIAYKQQIIAAKQTELLSQQTQIQDDQYTASKANLQIIVSDGGAYYFPINKQEDKYQPRHRLFAYVTLINGSSLPITVYEIQILNDNGGMLGKSHPEIWPSEKYTLEEYLNGDIRSLELDKGKHLKPILQIGAYEAKAGFIFFLPKDSAPIPSNIHQVQICTLTSREQFCSAKISLTGEPGIK